MLRQILQSSDINSKKLIKTASKNFIKIISKKHSEKSFREILSKQTGLKEKKRILIRELELLKTVDLSFTCT